MISSMEKINGYFEELVPASGKADSLAGELVRAVCRIGYRFYNDGDQLGIGYGKETCNPAGRFLMNKGSERIGDTVAIMWGKWNEEEYERRLDELVEAVIEHIEKHPELRTTETEDMWDSRDPEEDVDDCEEDEEEDIW